MIRATVALVALLVPASAWAQSALQTVKVADGVFVVLQPYNNRFNDSNCTFIVGPSSVMVIDSQVDEESTRAVIAEIKKVTDKPVRQVIATHWHGDHFQGNAAYRDAYSSVEFIAHESATEEMRTRAPRMRDEDVARLKASRPAEAERLARVEFVFPTVSVGEQTTWTLGDHVVHLLHFRGHTAGDLAIYLPRDRVLITGDLVDDMPYLGHGYPAEYLKTLETIGGLQWDTMVPGHGQIRRGKDHLRAVRDVFTAVYADVARAVRDGLTLEETTKRVNLAPHRSKLTYGDARAGRAFDGFMEAAIARMYEELSGRR